MLSISKIILKTDCEEIYITLEDARKLYLELDKLFGKKVVSNPIIIYRYPYINKEPYVAWSNAYTPNKNFKIDLSNKLDMNDTLY